MPLPRTIATSSNSYHPSIANENSSRTLPSTYPAPQSDPPSPPKFVLPKGDAGNSAADTHYYRQYEYGNLSAGNTAYPNSQQFIAAAAGPSSSQTVFTASLPRTSSLLPSARRAADLTSGQKLTTSWDAEDVAIAETPARSANTLEPPRSSRHSRSSSTGSISNTIRNLNRWSASTSSSRASNTLGGSGRRMSVDVLGFGSPRRFHKSRPSTSSSSPRPTSSRGQSQGQSPAQVPPFQSLPAITALPSLEQEVEQEVKEFQAAQTLLTIDAQAANRQRNHASGFYWDDSDRTPGEEVIHTSQQDTPRSLLPPVTIERGSAMPYKQNGETTGHSRQRSAGAKGSIDATSSGKGRDRGNKPPSQKAMLSRALQKANMAVQLDNAASFEEARTAYIEACDLLQQVLQRTSGEEDRKKLEAIRETYNSRIEELDQLIPLHAQAEEEPHEDTFDADQLDYSSSQNSNTYNGRAETSRTRATDERELGRDMERDVQSVPSYSVPKSMAKRQYNVRTPARELETPTPGPSTYLSDQYPLQSSFSKSSRMHDNEYTAQRRLDDQYMPPPLSPRKTRSPPPPTPVEHDSPGRVFRSDFSMSAPSRFTPSAMSSRGHERENSHESTSWLDPIDESGGSSPTSVHSRSSSLGVRRKHIRTTSDDTGAEFDAALDDAIEAAYDEGYDMEGQYEENHYEDEQQEAVTQALRRVEQARERVRESEREALELANERERRLRQQLEEEEPAQEELLPEELAPDEDIVEDFFDGNDSEDDEERILEEMTTGYVIEDFAFNSRPQPSVPRESDSSGLTSRTWHSSMASNPTTSMTVLTTLNEDTVISQPANSPPEVLPPPPTQALPQIPQASQRSPPQAVGSQSPGGQSVRNRRFSGQNPKQLKIETAMIAQAQAPVPAAASLSSQTRTGGYIAQQRQALSAVSTRAPPLSAYSNPSPLPGTAPLDDMTMPQIPPVPYTDGEPRSISPSVSRPTLRKNYSSSSLKSARARNPSITHIDEDVSPGTPLSSQFGVPRLPTMPTMPTPVVSAFKDRMNNSATGGLYLFESDFHTPRSPDAPDASVADTPVPLESCPNDASLRPFWLMRCLYQTLCHPRGGYVSNKLFVPRDVWRVKGVKLKNVEDKIANCDYLTAALQKLARVDTCDADAVLDEMQSLEGVLEQVQTALGRKLGNEVGVQGASAMIKEADEGGVPPLPRSMSVSGKASGFSWRRLRSKNSSAALGSSHNGKGGSGTNSKNGNGSATTPVDGADSKEGVVLPSVPMTSQPSSRPPKRDVMSVQFSGPNAQYMNSLARLFDAAQAIDQIARQVEDPGLRHADKTQVGLELCTRHAAEFFGFYICRFVLTDLTLLLDKFVKRGTEWVLT